MPLLHIKPTKKISLTCSIEESTMLLIDHYAAFLNVSGDDVIDNALEHVFKIDKDFQQYLSENKETAAPSSLRIVKKASSEPTGLKRGRKPTLPTAK